jgi:carbon monoxide dehydrogenase subunit G
MAVVRGERLFAAPRERVFALLADPDIVCSAIPAVRSHRLVDDDHFEAKVKAPVPLAPSVTIRFEVLERRPSEHAAIHAHGGGANVTSTFDLHEHEDGTMMYWLADFEIAGVLGRLVGHGLDGVAARQAARTLDAVERALAATTRGAASGT